MAKGSEHLHPMLIGSYQHRIEDRGVYFRDSNTSRKEILISTETYKALHTDLQWFTESTCAKVLLSFSYGSLLLE